MFFLRNIDQNNKMRFDGKASISKKHNGDNDDDDYNNSKIKQIKKTKKKPNRIEIVHDQFNNSKV